MYRAEARELLIEYELPRQDVVPAVAAYRYVKTKDLIQPVARKDAEIKKLYGELIARVTLRTLAEAFDIAPVTLASGIVFNGYVSAKDRATGRAVHHPGQAVQQDRRTRSSACAGRRDGGHRTRARGGHRAVRLAGRPA